MLLVSWTDPSEPADERKGLEPGLLQLALNGASIHQGMLTTGILLRKKAFKN